MRKIIITLTSILVIIILFNSCASVESVSKKITIESGEIPLEMKTDSFILIGILQEKKWFNKRIKEEFANYTGNYILSTQKEIASKYDINKYRYYMSYRLAYGSYYASGENHNITSYRLYLFDRKEDKIYLRKTSSSFFALEMRAYLIAIDRIRKK